MSHPRQLIFLWKSDYMCLGCSVLLCLNCCLFDLACFFLPSFFISLINMYMYMWYTCTCIIYTLYMYYAHFPLPPLPGEPPSSDVCHARGAQRLDVLGGVHCSLQVQGQVHRLLPHRNHTPGHPQHWYMYTCIVTVNCLVTSMYRRERKKQGKPQIYKYHFFCTTCIYTCTCRQLIFSRKSDCLGCAVLLCLVCLFV